MWYLLSAYAVISDTQNWVYGGFAAVGSWPGAYAFMTFLRVGPGGIDHPSLSPVERSLET